MAFDEPFNCGKMSMELFVRNLVEKNTEQQASNWLFEQATLVQAETGSAVLFKSFTLIPRKLGKKQISLSEQEQNELDILMEGWRLQDWTIDRLARVWLVMQLPSADALTYVQKIEALFANADMNELVALYSSLPVLAYPELWKQRCAEGIRSNIGTVLEAIMYHNPYAANWLDEAAWNQLVMKAFFTNKDLEQVTGLYSRNNKNLADILRDFAKERQAATRTVPDHLWELAEKFS